jgi:prepilin-type processing-associated H-X9-DG protein
MKQVGIALIQYSQDYDGTIVQSQLPMGATVATTVSWPTLIYPYVKNGDVFVCPGADDDVFTPDAKLINNGGATTTRKYTGVTDSNFPSSFSPATAGDGSAVGYSQVARLSYGRNLIPNSASAWTATNARPGYANFRSASVAKQGFVGTGTTSEITEADVPAPASTIHIMDAITGTASGDPRSLGNSIRGITEDIRTDMFPNDTASKVDFRHSGGFVALYGDGHAGWKKWGSTKPCDWTVQDDVCP